MKLPKKIHILGHEFKVIRDLDVEKRRKYGNVHGLFCSNEMYIYVNKNLKDHVAWQTFWHEIMHGIWYYNGHTLNISGEVEEMICESCAFSVVQILDQMKLAP
jgi:hypothetical protein